MWIPRDKGFSREMGLLEWKKGGKKTKPLKIISKPDYFSFFKASRARIVIVIKLLKNPRFRIWKILKGGGGNIYLFSGESSETGFSSGIIAQEFSNNVFIFVNVVINFSFYILSD